MKEAIAAELQSLKEFNVFEVCTLPFGKRPVGCKYVFKTKLKPTRDTEKYNVRIVAQGFLHEEGVDYNEIFAPVVDSTSVSLLLLVANQEDWEIEQMDVVTAFLHGHLEEEVYMIIPPFIHIEKRK